MNQTFQPTLLGLILVALLLANPFEALEDDGPRVLITNSGDRIETKEPWRVEGRRVLFRTLKGDLSAIRLSEVDLEKSRAASEPKAEPQKTTAHKPTAAAKAPALVLNQQNTGAWSGAAASPDGIETEEGEEGSTSVEGEAPSSGKVIPESKEGSAASPAESLEVTSWQDLSEAGSSDATVYGTLKNTGSSKRRRVTVTVELLDEAGHSLAKESARLVRPNLNPGQTSNFQAFFAGAPVYKDAKFYIDAE